MDVIIQPTQDEFISNPFTTTDRGFWLFGSKFWPEELAVLEQIGPSGNYEPITNAKGVIAVSHSPNTVYADVPPGTYRIHKYRTKLAASVGIHEVV